MTENKNGLNITMDNKEMMRIGAIAVLILDIIFMLSSYIKIDAISQLASLIGGYSDMNLGNGKYTFFGMISLIRKIIVLNDSDYAPVSYLFMTFFWGLHIIVIGITVKGAINLFTKQIDNVHTNGKAGTIFGFCLAVATIIFCIVVNLDIESETDGYISGLVGLCFAPFCVCALCIVYNMYFMPKLTAQAEETEKKCDNCDLEFEHLPEVYTWKCEFCDTLNSQDEEYCKSCGFARLSTAEIMEMDKRNDNGTKYCSNCGAPKEEPQTETKEIRFKHTCSQCGKTFEVKFNMQKGQTTIPKLSATCPQCNSKENVTF